MNFKPITLLALGLLTLFISNTSHAFDPRDFLIVDKNQIPFDDHFFDKTTNLLKLTNLENVSLDDSDATSKIKSSISVQGITKTLLDSRNSIFVYEYDCGYGLIVTEQVFSKKHDSKKQKNKIEIRGLHLGMTKEDVQKILVLGKVRSGYFGKIETNKKKHFEVWYSNADKYGSNRTISISTRFDDEEKLIKFEIVMSDC